MYAYQLWLIHATLLDAWEIERFLTAKVTFKVTQGHGYWCHSR